MVVGDAKQGQGQEDQRDERDEPERPTLPDVESFECPACPGEDGLARGYVMVTVDMGAGYSAHPQSCDVCWGKKLVDRQALERYRARATTAAGTTGSGT